MPRGIIALVFACKITGGHLVTTDETAAYRWVSRDEVIDLANEAYAVRISYALDQPRPPAVRQHDGIHLL
jgi:8-oxo-dGTP diphosphatase